MTTLVPWTYTLLSTLDNCQHQAFRRYILKDIPYVEGSAQREGKRVHKAFEERIKMGVCLPDDLRDFDNMTNALDHISNANTAIVECEVQLGMREDGSCCDYYAKDVWGRGKADIVIRNETTACIYDLKTGKVREDPFQLEVEALLLKANHPSLQVFKGRFLWLRDAKAGVDYDLSNTMRTEQKVRHFMGIIEQCRANNNWLKTPSPLCDWCEVKDCQHYTGKNVGV